MRWGHRGRPGGAIVIRDHKEGGHNTQITNTRTQKRKHCLQRGLFLTKQKTSSLTDT